MNQKLPTSLVGEARLTAVLEASREQGRKALIPFITAGDPSPGATVAVMHGLVAAGADVIELGMPFSDPMADGPAIQRSSERALAQGVGLADVLSMVTRFRERDTRTPVVLMGYANPIELRGLQAFVSDALAAGVDGVLVVDYPPEEAGPFSELLASQGLAPIFLLAPTSTETRMQAVLAQAKGYVYYVSVRGVTGAKQIDMQDIAERCRQIRKFSSLPIGIGFGIRDAASAQAVAEHGDAVVIGSALVDYLYNQQQSWQQSHGASAIDWAEVAYQFLQPIRQALDQLCAVSQTDHPGQSKE